MQNNVQIKPHRFTLDRMLQDDGFGCLISAPSYLTHYAVLFITEDLH